MKNKLTPEQIKVNKLTSTLEEMIIVNANEHLNKNDLIGYFTVFMQDAEVDNEIIFKTLESFGEEGKEQILTIKINEGY